MSPELPESLRVAFLVIDVLEELRIEYHVGGSFASSIHGIPRQTQDVGLVVVLHAARIEPFAARLKEDFYVDPGSAHAALRELGSFNLIHFESGIKVDLFIRGETQFDLEEFSRSRLETLTTSPDRHALVKSPEDTILRKLKWYRDGGESSDRQWTDVVGVIRTQGERLDFDYLTRWAQELGIADLLERARR